MSVYPSLNFFRWSHPCWDFTEICVLLIAAWFHLLIHPELLHVCIFFYFLSVLMNEKTIPVAPNLTSGSRGKC